MQAGKRHQIVDLQGQVEGAHKNNGCPLPLGSGPNVGHTHTCSNDLGEAWAEARCARLHLDVGFEIHMDVWKA